MAAGAATTWNDALQVAAVTDVGMRRVNNQDSHSVILAADEAKWRRRGHIFLVADGMGAHAAGELASKLTADGIPHLFQKYIEESAQDALQRAVAETNAEVHRRGQANAEFHNMGTTMSSLVLLPQGALVAHIGDSRVYRFRGDVLEQLTFDHSLVWELRAAGQLTPGSDFARSVPKNVITRSIGPKPNVVADLEGFFPIEKGDTYLLCSDGLTGEVSDLEIGAILAALPPEEAGRALIDIGNLRGGPDNITVIVVRVVHDRMTTRVAMAEEEEDALTPKPREMSPFYWFAGLVLLLASGIFWVVDESHILSYLTMVAALVVPFVGILRKYGPTWAAYFRREKYLGKGPYTSTNCTQPGAFVDSLAKLVKELQDVGQSEHWTIGWPTLERHVKAAEEAASQKRPLVAVREYSRAISFCMQELRRVGQKRTSASVLDD
jgi:serine/threonine protein phosphatase PrpC